MNFGSELYQIIESRKCFLCLELNFMNKAGNLKILSNFRIPNSIKYGAGFSLLFAKMHRRQLF